MVPHRPRRPDTLEVHHSLYRTGRKQGRGTGRHFAQPQVGASRRPHAEERRTSALMLRSIAARRERRRFRRPNAPRCVSKHEGAAVLILRDARTRLRVRGASSASALLRMRTNIACCKAPIQTAGARAGWSDPCIFLFFCRFGIFHPRSHDLKHTHTSSFPRRIFAPGVLRLCFTHPESRGGRSAEKRSGARRNTRGACT